MMEKAYPLSQRAGGLERSMMRELLKQAVRPGMISFATGFPPSDCIPVGQIGECFNYAFQQGSSNLQYGPPNTDLLKWIAGYMLVRGVDCTPEDIFITNGSQQGLYILSQLLLDVGDAVVAEETVFSGIAQILKGNRFHIQTVPTDLHNGIDTDALATQFSQYPPPRAAIVIPDFHNPLGVSLSREKREYIADLAYQHNVIVIEDDPYSLLRFQGERIPPVKAYDRAEHVMYIGSFSKMLAPAFRLGWIVLPQSLRWHTLAFREMIDLETSRLTQAAVATFLKRGYLEPHLQNLRTILRSRCNAMLHALENHLADVAAWTMPDGGLFIWLTLPENINTLELVQEAMDENVVFVPGSAFSANKVQHNTMRLSFANVTPDQIEEGIARLARIINTKLSLKR